MQAILASVIIALLVCVDADAQSGRRRTRYPESEQPAAPIPSVKVPLTTAVVKQEQHGGVSRFVLKNGMTVIVGEAHAYPIAATVAYVKGSFGAIADLTAARVLQQLMLRGGTQANAGGAMTKQIEDAGGRVVADSTIGGSYFVARFPSTQIKQTIALEADLLQNAALPPPELAAAIDASRNEELGCCQEPALYGRRRAVAMSLGVESTAGVYDQISIERLRALYADRYKPENLILVVTGDVTTFDVLVQIEQLYAQFGVPPPSPEPAGDADAKSAGKAQTAPATSASSGSASTQAPSTGGGTGASNAASSNTATPASGGTAQPHQAPIPGSPSVNYANAAGSIHQAIVTAAFRTQGLRSPDWAAVQVLADLMAKGPASMLGSHLVIDQAAARSVTTDSIEMPDSGVLTIQMLVAPELIDKAEAEFFKTVDRAIVEPAAAGDLTEAKNLAELSFYDQVATYDNRALFFAEAEASGRPPMIIAEYADLIRAVTADDLQRAARQYLATQNTSIFEYQPATAPARTFDQYSYARTVEAWAPGLEQAPPKTALAKAVAIKRMAEVDAVVASEGQSVQPLPVKDFSTLNGPKAFVREDHSLPRVTIGLLFQGGRLTESASNSGVTELMLRSMLAGTKRLNSVQLSSRLAELGADIEIVNQPDYFGFLVNALSTNADKALKVMREVVEEPALGDADIESARKQQFGAAFESQDEGPQRALEMLLETIYPGHPYGLPPHGIEQVLATLKADQVREWYEKTIQMQYPLVIIVGDTQGSELISEQIAGGFSRRTLAKSIQALVPKQSAEGEKVAQTACTRTLIGLAFPGPKSNSPDMPVMDVIASAIYPARIEKTDVFGDTDSLWVEPMMVAGAVYSLQTIKSSDLPQVKTAFTALVRGLADKGITDAELKTARGRAQAARVARLYSEGDLALEYARALFSGQQASAVDSYPEQLSKVTAADVKRVATTYLKPAQVSTAVLLEVQPKPAPQPQR